MTNHYTVLGVSESATPEVVRIAYEGKLKELGRARIAGPQLEAEEKQLHEAYRTLSDPRRREAHDAQLAGALDKVEQRSRTLRLALFAALVVALFGGLSMYLADRAERLEAVRQEEARLAREEDAARARAAAEEVGRRHSGLEKAAAEAKAQKEEAEERQRIARERRRYEIESAQAQAAAERRAAEERNRRR